MTPLRSFLCVSLISATTLTTFAQGTAFTYQGRLNHGANLASGSYDLRFALFDAAGGGVQQGNALTNAATAISNGLFTVTLDFGNQFPGADRWLEIGIRTNGGGAFTSLSPRQPITSTPYAVRALDAGSAASYAGAISDSQLSGNIARLNGSNVFSGVVQFNNATNNFAGTFTGNGSGVTNVTMTTLNAPGILSWPGNYVLVTSPGVGNQPRSVVAADVNGDGKPDLISANSSGNSLTILTNNGNGGFVAASTNAVGVQPRSVAAADVNGDGKPDLICTSQSPGTLIVLTNPGNGNFVSASTNVIGPGVGNPQMVIAADINGDGKPDLISANGNSSGSLSVFTNNGIGGFVLSSTNSVANNPFAVTAADVNGDNSPDLISANNNAGGTLSVLLNNGSGGFSPAIHYLVGNSPRSVTTADVNGDGFRDVISANNGDGTLSVSLNNGSGGFPVGTPISIGSTPIWVTAADLNGDGRVDLICANNSPGTLTAVTNNGSGIFLPAFTNSVGVTPNAVIVADVNGDGKVDLVSANGIGTLSILFNLPSFSGAFAGNGAGLTSLNASQLASGTVTDARLSVNVPLLTGGPTFAGTVTAASFVGPGAMPWQVVSGTTQQAQPNTGYLLTNNALVTVTLPTAPNPADVVRLSGVGAGGWKIAQNASQSVLAKNVPGNIGNLWVPRDSDRNWTSVASSLDGNKLVATAPSDQIYTSTDSGLTWAPHATGLAWNAVGSSADGSKLVATSVGGLIYTSTDSGTNWTSRDIARTWYAVASSSNGNKLVGVVNNGRIYTSTDSGTNWIGRDSTRIWYAVASSADGNKLVAVVNGGQIYTSTDSGTNWTARESDRSWVSVGSSADGSKLVAAVQSGQIYTSTDSGTNWTARESSRNWKAVASSADGSKLVATVYGGQIFTSTDSGVTWTQRESSRNWQAVASSGDGSKLVAVVSVSGRIYTSSPDSTVGAAGYLLGDQHSAVELQYIGNGQFVPLSSVGTIIAY